MDQAIFFYSMFMCGIQLCLEFYFFMRITNTKGRAWQYATFTSVTLCLLYLLHPYGSNLLNVGLAVVTMLLSGILFLGVKFSAGLSAAFLINMIMQLCFGIFNSLMGIFSPLVYTPASQPASLLFMGVTGILSLVFMCLCLTILNKKFSVRHGVDKNYIYMVFTPLMMIFMASAYISGTVYGSTITMDAHGNMLGANHYQMLFLQTFCLLSVFSVLYAYENICANALADNKLALLEQESSFQKKYVEEAKMRYDSTNAFRHDIRNHLSVLSGLVERGKNDDALQYLHGLNVNSSDLSFPFATNNPSVDILLCSKLESAAKLSVQIQCKVKIPASCGIEDIDLCTVFFNAVDNALNACIAVPEGLRYLTVSDSVQGDFYMLAFENSKTPSEDPNSSQTSDDAHKGLGLFNIKTVAEKYGGTLIIENTADTFRLHVLFVISHH